MRSLVVLAALSSGCFSSWALVQVTGTQRALDERAREERVPMPDVRERLRVTMPLAPRPGAGATYAFECSSSQTATDTVYRSGFRYGSRWKKVAAVMFLVEAGIASAYYFASDRSQPKNQLAIGFFGLDALGTAALFFVPRKEVHDTRREHVVEPFRNDCPAGLLLEIGGTTYPIDAAGRLDEVGEHALDGWMERPATPIRLTYHGRVVDVPLGQNEVCTYLRVRGLDQSRCPAYWAVAPTVTTSLEVPLGTLTRSE